jgi:small-conductance mechanosensitive channel
MSIAAVARDETPWFYGLALLLVLLLFRFLPGRPGDAAALAAAARAVAAARHSWRRSCSHSRAQASVAQGLHQAAVLGLGVVLIRLAGLALFRVLLPALHAPTPRIVEDIVVIGGYLLWGMVRLSFAGVELSSLVATSAVITAVLAFAMQDTLGNILGGLALQLDDSLGSATGCGWTTCRAASSRSSGASPRCSRATARRSWCRTRS